MNPRNTWLVLVWVLAVGDAAALSLGSVHGRVLLGRPVDLVFDVQLDPGMDLESSCLAAELVSGENPVGRGQVRLLPLPQTRGHTPAVRVQTTMLADEPVLTVALSVGCAGKITRTYTFLADLPDTVLPSTAPVAIPWEPQPVPPAMPERVATAGAGGGEPATSPVAAAPARPPVAAASEPAPSSSAAVGAAPRRAAPAPAVPRARPASTPQPVAAASAAMDAASRPVAPAPRPRPASRPRLVMEPLAVVMSQAPRPGAAAAQAAPAAALEPASTPASAASMPQAPASAASGAEAAASVAGDAASAALASQPESLRILKLQEELARVRMQAASDHAAALALQQRVDLIESERFHPGVVYGLLAFVGLLLAWMAWQVLRFRTAFEQSTRAWSESVAQYESKKAGEAE